MTRLRYTFALIVASSLLGLASGATSWAQQAPAAQAPLAPPTGDATRGKTLFEQTLRCYACHGFDGQSGSPRLVPMARAEDIFLAYVRKPTTPGMPSFVATPEAELRDVYAYIRAIPQAAPTAESVPLLKGILDRRAKAN